MKKNKSKIVFWDWNGTLFDDVEVAIESRNTIFPKFNLSKINSIEEYRSEFTFPIKQYYAQAGVTDEMFDEVAHAWIAEYQSRLHSIPLRSGAVQVLQTLQNAGVNQVVLSASKQEHLVQQVKQFNIEKYFISLLGIDNIYAESKIKIAIDYCEKLNSQKFIIGDTVHDYEVSQAIHAECLLLSGGHQSDDILKSKKAIFVNDIMQVADIIIKY